MIAIDPGSSSGAIVHNVGIRLVSINMPKTVEGLWRLLHLLTGPILGAPAAPLEVVMEDVGHGFPGNSAKSMFTFAKHRGHLDMAIAALGLAGHRTLVLPSVWMHGLYGDQLPKGRKKDDTKRRKDYIWADMVRRYPSFGVTKRNADAFALYTWAIERREQS